MRLAQRAPAEIAEAAGDPDRNAGGRGRALPIAGRRVQRHRTDRRRYPVRRGELEVPRRQAEPARAAQADPEARGGLVGQAEAGVDLGETVGYRPGLQQVASEVEARPGQAEVTLGR